MQCTILPTRTHVEEELQEKLKDLQTFLSNHKLPCFAVVGSYSSNTGLPVYHQVIEKSPEGDFDFGVELHNTFFASKPEYPVQTISSYPVKTKTAIQVGAELRGTQAAEITRADLDCGRAALRAVINAQTQSQRDEVNQRAGLLGIAQREQAKK